MKGGYEMRYTLIIAGRLDNMNDYTSARRTNQYKGAKLKQKKRKRCQTGNIRTAWKIAHQEASADVLSMVRAKQET